LKKLLLAEMLAATFFKKHPSAVKTTLLFLKQIKYPTNKKHTKAIYRILKPTQKNIRDSNYK